MKHDGDLETLLGYQMQRADLAMTGDARDVLEPHGLTPAKLTALMLIRANPGCDQTALGRALSINRSSAMKLVNVLVALGLIERRAGRNLRTNALHLLPHGEDQIAELLNVLRDSDHRMSARLSDAERKTLFGLLRKIGPARARRSAESDLS
ncbi:MarR family transcriptional regulator [Sphingomonas sp. SUN019]|uniref:MarR family winged helix-turn-helix transcriptional regulator n=1 Tax=Sphingomonas sp. SUN019 TaxID=2937788 RepID=UPI0021649D29|nr:MarR family transcriptional regulator [Sphingomonas sp. SUN019]UVO50600.1 MarR family transcriptional regulator [Sphingomonas sp. SUN019]